MRRLSRFRLSLIVVITVVVLSAVSPPVAPAASKQQNERKDLPDVSETANSVLNEDGTYTTSLYTGRVNYRDDKREFKDIAKDLVPSDVPGYAWSNGANQFNAEFKAVLGKDFLRLDAGGNSFSFTLDGSLPVPGAALGAEVTYPGALAHVTLSYHALPDEVRKYLTLVDPLAQSTFRFILTPPEGVPSQVFWTLSAPNRCYSGGAR